MCRSRRSRARRVVAPEPAQEALEDRVDQAAALERVDPVDCLRLLERLDAQHVPQEVAVRARRVHLQPARRDSPSAREVRSLSRRGQRVVARHHAVERRQHVRQRACRASIAPRERRRVRAPARPLAAARRRTSPRSYSACDSESPISSAAAAPRRSGARARSPRSRTTRRCAPPAPPPPRGRSTTAGACRCRPPPRARTRSTVARARPARQARTSAARRPAPCAAAARPRHAG